MAKIFATNPSAFVDGDPGLLKEQVELDLRPEALSSAPSELPQLDVAVAASSKTPQSAPTTLPPGGGSNDDGTIDGGTRDDGTRNEKLNAIRREISQVTDAMAQMSDKLADLQRQLREVSEQQGAGAGTEVDSPELPAGNAREIDTEIAGNESTAVAEEGNPNPVELADPAIAEQSQVVSESQSEDSYWQSVPMPVESRSAEQLAGETEQISASADAVMSPTDSVAEADTATESRPTESEVDSYGWLRWLALPLVLILALLWWRRREKESMPLAAESGRDAQPDWLVSAPRARPRAPASEEFGDLFSDLAQENRRDLPGTTSQSVRSAMDAPRSGATAPPSTRGDESAESRPSAFSSSAFDSKDFAESSPVDSESTFAETNDILADLDFDDIDLDRPLSQISTAEDAEATAERAAACVALADYTGARDILEAALQGANNTALQLQLLDVYAVQGESAEFEALALKMEVDGADDGTLAEIQLIREKLGGSRDSSDYNGRSA